jgi:hypothetical protein
MDISPSQMEPSPLQKDNLMPLHKVVRHVVEFVQPIAKKTEPHVSLDKTSPQ